MKRKIIKRIVFVLLTGIAVAGAIGTYLFFKPHRNVQETKAFAELKVADLVNEFTADANKANAKYLASDGNSKVLIIEGRVNKIAENQSGEKVIILKDDGAKVGVSATFSKTATANIQSVKTGDIIKIKGAITAGNRYDADLDLYEHATLVQCDLIK
ncbi:MAG: hypothetical protein JST58_03310 [Bacteroidetes bacterium]|nr:hypothetical protein [Bacteroidota bacterium]